MKGLGWGGCFAPGLQQQLLGTSKLVSSLPGEAREDFPETEGIKEVSRLHRDRQGDGVGADLEM